MSNEDKNNKPMIWKQPNGDEIALTINTVRQYCVTGERDFVTDQEIVKYMHQCKALRLNPFIQECWLIKYSKNENAQIVQSIHSKRERAMMHEKCEGWQKGLIILTKEGNVERTNGLLPPDAKLIGAWFKTQPRGWKVPFDHEINIDGYIQRKKNGVGFDVICKRFKHASPSITMRYLGIVNCWSEEKVAAMIF